MKKSIIYVVFVGVFIIMASCARQSRFINPEYSNKKFYNPLLLLPQYENSDFIKNEDLFHELEIYYTREEYYSYFISIFEKSIQSQSTFERIQYIKYDTIPHYETRILDLNQKEKFTFDLPPRPLKVDRSGSVFILFLEDLLLTFSKKTKEATTSTRSYSASGLTERDVKLNAVKKYKYYIILESKYVLYDDSTGDLVSYGTVSNLERFIPPTPIESSLHRLIKGFAGKIFKQTPFEK